jgi:hypothetical protein
VNDYDVVIPPKQNHYDDSTLFTLIGKRIKVFHPKVNVRIGVFKSIYFDYRALTYTGNFKSGYQQDNDTDNRYNIWKLIENGRTFEYYLDIIHDVKVKILSDNPNDFGRKI